MGEKAASREPSEQPGSRRRDAAARAILGARAAGRGRWRAGGRRGGAGSAPGPQPAPLSFPRGFCGKKGGEEEPTRDGDPGEGLRGLVARRLSARKGENARVGCRDRGAP